LSWLSNSQLPPPSSAPQGLLSDSGQDYIQKNSNPGIVGTSAFDGFNEPTDDGQDIFGIDQNAMKPSMNDTRNQVDLFSDLAI